MMVVNSASYRLKINSNLSFLINLLTDYYQSMLTSDLIAI